MGAGPGGPGRADGALVLDFENLDCSTEASHYTGMRAGDDGERADLAFLTQHAAWHDRPAEEGPALAAASPAPREDTERGLVASCWVCGTCVAGAWPSALQEHVTMWHPAEQAPASRRPEGDTTETAANFWALEPEPETPPAGRLLADEWGEVCAICLQPRWASVAGAAAAVVRLRSCGHVFHEGCITACTAMEGQSLSCPLCRRSFGAKAVKEVAVAANAEAAAWVVQQRGVTRARLEARLVARQEARTRAATT